MLVSMMARMNAMRMRQQAQSDMLRSHMTMQSMMHGIGSGAFSGASLGMLHAMDQKLEMDMFKSQMDYQIASLMEKSYAKQCSEEIKQNSGLNIFA